MLIGQLWDVDNEEHSNTPMTVPVVGERKSSIPTSSDVHLYHDPIGDRATPETPLLFADCEGFEGADRSSAARIVAQATEALAAGEPQWNEEVRRWVNILVRSTLRTFKRPLSWSQSVNGHRQEALKQLFPRLLYNVSDVVVYVMTKPELKKIGAVLQQLVEWSQKSGTAAINRAALPSLIIVLNWSHTAGTDWDPGETTTRYLKENQDIAATLKARLESLDINNGSLEAILKCFYTSVKFICIPEGDDLARLASQVKILREMIEVASTQAHKAKKAANMLLTSEHQDLFYHLAFEHFSKHKDEIFDFIKTFFSIHPLPLNLPNTFLNLIRSTQEALIRAGRPPSSETLARDLLKAIVPVISSAIAINIHRSCGRLPGPLPNFIRGEMSELQDSDLEMQSFSYEKQVGTAVQQFVETSCQCWYTNSKTGQKCVNKEVAHQIGRPHQGAQGNNIGFGMSGLFEADPFRDWFIRSWENEFWNAIAGLEAVRTSSPPQEQTVSLLPELWRIRKESIREMYTLAPDLDFTDLSVCLWCLQGIPTERLPCGHWICEYCLLEIGEPSPHDDRLRLVNQCDRHPGGKALDPPFEFLHLPRSAGRRLLCLDEGGARGIVELVILAGTQEKLGQEIKLQDCFDLIGGTGAGGVIALGLALGQWDVSDAIKKFKPLARHAFSERNGWGIFPWSSKLTYRSEHLDQSIHDAFGTEGKLPMTNSMSMQGSSGKGPARVFVTASVAGRGGEVLTNYNRRRDVEKTQHGSVSHTHSCALKIEQAARATVSFPGYFDSFQRPDGDRYLGGGLDFSNPAQVTLLEAQYLWPQALKPHPDILVSIGPGYSGDAPASSNSSTKTNGSGDCKNTETIWSNSFGESSRRNPARYIRLCPRFPKSLSDAHDAEPSQYKYLEQVTAEFLRHDQQRAQTQDNIGSKVELIVRRLISTTFYFHQTLPVSLENEKLVILGYIRCRFKDTSNITKAFGERIGGLEDPRFVLGSSELLWSFDEESLNRMKSEGKFCAPVRVTLPTSSSTVDIKFTANSFSAESISGCPFSTDILFKPV